MPKITAIMPTYNRGRFIADAISSVLAQTYADFELIVVDDGSTDNTAEILEKFNSSKIRYFYKEHTCAPDTLNLGLKHAKGDFIIIVDSDDMILPKAFEELLGEFDRDPKIDVVYGDFILMDQFGKQIGKLKHQNFPNNKVLIESFVWNNPLPSPGTMVRKKCYDEVGFYDPFFTTLAYDYELWTRMLRSYKFKYVHKYLYCWRKHSSSLSGPNKESVYDADVLKKILERYSLAELFPWIDWEYQDPQIAKAIAYITIGKIFFYRDAYSESIKYFMLSLENCPFPETYCRLAEIYQKQGDPNEARKCLQAALKIDPEYKQACEALFPLERFKNKIRVFFRPKRKIKTVFYIIGHFAKLGGAESQFVSLILNRKSAGYKPVVFSYAPIYANNPYVLKLKEAGIKVIAPWAIFTNIIRFLHSFILKISILFTPIYALFKKLNYKQAKEKLHNEIDFEFKYRLAQTISDFVFYLILSWKDLFYRAGFVHSFRCDFGTRLAVTWARRHSVPMIYSERGGVDRKDYYQKPWFYSSKKLKEINRYCTIIVLSRQIRQRAWKIFGPESKIAAISNCIPDFNMSPSKPRMQFTIGSLGRLSHEKGYDILLQAIKLVRDKGIEIKCIIGGSGVEQDDLMIKSRDYDIIDNISFIGTIKEGAVPEFLNKIDVFVLPSRTEGMPTSLLQSMIAGKPNIATKVGSIPEIASNGGVLLVEKENPEELAKAIISLYENENLRQEIGANSRKNYLENYVPNVVWPKWDEIYKRLSCK